MAISWLTVLRNVPWTDVISNAPRVADGAKKLWTTVANKQEPADLRTPPTGAARTTEAAAVAGLRTQIGELDEEVRELHEQMLASSGLIRDLADQNAQLIARIDVLRRRLAWTAGAAGLALVAAAAAVALATAG